VPGDAGGDEYPHSGRLEVHQPPDRGVLLELHRCGGLVSPADRPREGQGAVTTGLVQVNRLLSSLHNGDVLIYQVFGLLRVKDFAGLSSAGSSESCQHHSCFGETPHISSLLLNVIDSLVGVEHLVAPPFPPPSPLPDKISRFVWQKGGGLDAPPN